MSSRRVSDAVWADLDSLHYNDITVAAEEAPKAQATKKIQLTKRMGNSCALFCVRGAPTFNNFFQAPRLSLSGRRHPRVMVRNPSAAHCRQTVFLLEYLTFPHL